MPSHTIVKCALARLSAPVTSLYMTPVTTCRHICTTTKLYHSIYGLLPCQGAVCADVLNFVAFCTA